MKNQNSTRDNNGKTLGGRHGILPRGLSPIGPPIFGVLPRPEFARRSRNYEGIKQGGEREAEVEGKRFDNVVDLPAKILGESSEILQSVRGWRGGRGGGGRRDKRGLKVDEDPGDIGAPVKRNQNSN